MAAQILEPHAISKIDEGTYVSFAGVSLSEVKTESQGNDEPLIPPTTHVASLVHARAYAELGSDATFVHVLPKLAVRSIRHPDESFANPMQVRPSQFSDVRAAHVMVENPVRTLHVAPPSLVTYTSIPLDEFSRLAMHVSCEVHESDVTVSCDKMPKLTGVDHVAPPSSVVRNSGLPFTVSRIAHVIAA
jgi:hypothetical protein